MSSIPTLASYLQDRWQCGEGRPSLLYDATTGEACAQVLTSGFDLAAALTHARRVGGPALRKLTFAQRGELLGQLSAALHARRDDLIDTARVNMGTTRGDAKFDIDGATGTLAFYAALGKSMGDKTFMLDGDQIRISRSSRFLGQHVLTPRLGVAVHINAFNFPAWNLCEKLACAILGGMPVLAKPGTATAWTAVRIAEIWVEHKLLPPGVFSLLAGPAGDLLDHVGAQDCIVFTGSGSTARAIRSHKQVLAQNVPVNVEADSLNAAVLGPDVEESSDTFTMFISDVAKEMTQKAGQKCTAVRRIVVPEASQAAVRAALVEKLTDAVIGDPANARTTVGPLASPNQMRDVQAGIEQLAQHAERIHGGDTIVPGQGFFVAPQLFYSAKGKDAAFVHEHEVFGPVATLLSCSGEAQDVIDIVAAGGGGLVCSVYSDDKDWAGTVLLGLAPWHGRILWGSARVSDQGTGQGAVLPSLVHGGPGKAGGGEELGGERGLRFYWQRTAIQGDTQLLRAVFGGGPAVASAAASTGAVTAS